MAQRRKLPPIHPGALLRDELAEIGVSLNELARALRVPMNRISGQRQEGHQCGHRDASGPVFRNLAAVLVESSGRLRPRGCRAGNSAAD